MMFFFRVYPRVGGGTCFLLKAIRSVVGLSPRGRGNLWSGLSPRGRGNLCESVPGTHSPVYPRVGGGTPICYQRGHFGRSARSIPAWAGGTDSLGVSNPRQRKKVYPRVGGGTRYG